MKFILSYAFTEHYYLLGILDGMYSKNIVSSFYTEDGIYTDATNPRILKRYA